MSSDLTKGDAGSPKDFASRLKDVDTVQMESLIVEACKQAVRPCQGAPPLVDCPLSMYAQFCGQPACCATFSRSGRNMLSYEWRAHLGAVHQTDCGVVQNLIKDLQAVALAEWQSKPEAARTYLQLVQAQHQDALQTPAPAPAPTATPAAAAEAGNTTKAVQLPAAQDAPQKQVAAPAPVASAPVLPNLSCPWACGVEQLPPGMGFAAHMVMWHLHELQAQAAVRDTLVARAVSEHACPFRHADGRPCKALRAKEALEMSVPAWWDHIHKKHMHDALATTLHLFRRTECEYEQLCTEARHKRQGPKPLVCPLPRCHSQKGNPSHLLQHLIQHLRYPNAHPPMTQELLLCASSVAEAHARASAAAQHPLRVRPDVLAEEQEGQYATLGNKAVQQQDDKQQGTRLTSHLTGAGGTLSCPFLPCCKMDKGHATSYSSLQDLQQHIQTAHTEELFKAWGVISRVACMDPHTGMLLCPIREPAHGDSTMLSQQCLALSASGSQDHAAHHVNGRELVAHLHTHHTLVLLVLAAFAQGLVEQALPCPACPHATKAQALLTPETALLHLLQCHPSEMLQVVHCVQLAAQLTAGNTAKAQPSTASVQGKSYTKTSGAPQAACLLNLCSQTTQAADAETATLGAMMHAARAHPLELYDHSRSAAAQAALPGTGVQPGGHSPRPRTPTRCNRHGSRPQSPTCRNNGSPRRSATPEQLLRSCMLTSYTSPQNSFQSSQVASPRTGSPGRTQLQTPPLDTSQPLPDSTSGRLRVTVPAGALGVSIRDQLTVSDQGVQADVISTTVLAKEYITGFKPRKSTRKADAEVQAEVRKTHAQTQVELTQPSVSAMTAPGPEARGTTGQEVPYRIGTNVQQAVPGTGTQVQAPPTAQFAHPQGMMPATAAATGAQQTGFGSMSVPPTVPYTHNMASPLPGYMPSASVPGMQAASYATVSSGGAWEGPAGVMPVGQVGTPQLVQSSAFPTHNTPSVGAGSASLQYMSAQTPAAVASPVTGQSMGQPDGQSMRQPTGQFVGQSNGQIVSQPNGQSVSQPDGQFVSQPNGQFIGQPNGQPMGQPTGQFLGQPTGQMQGGMVQPAGMQGAAAATVQVQGVMPHTASPALSMASTAIPVSFNTTAVSAPILGMGSAAKSQDTSNLAAYQPAATAVAVAAAVASPGAMPAAQTMATQPTVTQASAAQAPPAQALPAPASAAQLPAAQAPAALVTPGPDPGLAAAVASLRSSYTTSAATAASTSDSKDQSWEQLVAKMGAGKADIPAAAASTTTATVVGTTAVGVAAPGGISLQPNLLSEAGRTGVAATDAGGAAKMVEQPSLNNFTSKDVSPANGAVGGTGLSTGPALSSGRSIQPAPASVTNTTGLGSVIAGKTSPNTTTSTSTPTPTPSNLAPTPNPTSTPSPTATPNSTTAPMAATTPSVTVATAKQPEVAPISTAAVAAKQPAAAVSSTVVAPTPAAKAGPSLSPATSSAPASTVAVSAGRDTMQANNATGTASNRTPNPNLTSPPTPGADPKPTNPATPATSSPPAAPGSPKALAPLFPGPGGAPATRPADRSAVIAEFPQDDVLLGTVGAGDMPTLPPDMLLS